MLVNRNHFGRQVESFEAAIHLPFLKDLSNESPNEVPAFKGVFIRAPVVEDVFSEHDISSIEERNKDAILAPSCSASSANATQTRPAAVEVLAALPGRVQISKTPVPVPASSRSNIIAVRQGHVFGTSFHPELTNDARIHVWWLGEILKLNQGDQ